MTRDALPTELPRRGQKTLFSSKAQTAFSSFFLHSPPLEPKTAREGQVIEMSRFFLFFFLFHFLRVFIITIRFIQNELDFNGFTKDPTIQIRMGWQKSE